MQFLLETDETLIYNSKRIRGEDRMALNNSAFVISDFHSWKVVCDYVVPLAEHSSLNFSIQLL